MSSTAEVLEKLGEGMKAQTEKITKLRAELDSSLQTREEMETTVKTVSERCDELAKTAKENADALALVNRQFASVKERSDTEVDPRYYNPSRRRMFPNQRSAADFCYQVGAGLFRDSECMTRCEERDIEVTYLRGSDERDPVDILQTRDMQVGSDQDGGYAVTLAAQQVIWDIAEEWGDFAGNALVVPMTALEKTLLLPKDGIEMHFMDELEQAVKSGVGFARVVLKAKKVGGYAMWSNEFAEDVAAFIGENLSQLFGQALARKIDHCGFVGDGSSTFGGITGVLHHPGCTLISLPATKTSFSDITTEDVRRLKFTAPAKVRKRRNECAYIIHPDVLQYIDSLVDETDNKILKDRQDGTGYELMKYRVIESDCYPDTGESDAGKPFISFGSLNRSFALGERRKLRIRKLSEIFALRDADALVAFARFDIQAYMAEYMVNMQTADS